MGYSKIVEATDECCDSPLPGKKTSVQIRADSELLVARSKLLVKQTSIVTRASSDILKGLNKEQLKPEIC